MTGVARTMPRQLPLVGSHVDLHCYRGHPRLPREPLFHGSRVSTPESETNESDDDSLIYAMILSTKPDYVLHKTAKRSARSQCTATSIIAAIQDFYVATQVNNPLVHTCFSGNL